MEDIVKTRSVEECVVRVGRDEGEGDEEAGTAGTSIHVDVDESAAAAHGEPGVEGDNDGTKHDK